MYRLMMIFLCWQRTIAYGVGFCLCLPATALADELTPKLSPHSSSAWLPAFSAQPNPPRSTPDLFRRRPRPSVPASPPPNHIPSVAELEQAIYQQVNQYRLSKGLLPLVLDARISTIARQHSQDMADKRVPFGHIGLQQRLYSVDRIIPTRRVAENAAYIFSHNNTADRAFRGWLRSHAHRQAIEASYYRYTGIGVAQDQNGGFYFTQLYVRPR